MKVHNVRVTRVSKVTVTEYVDVPVPLTEDEGDAKEAAERAKTFVEASVDAGQDVDWVQVSEVPEKWPRTEYSAEIITPEGK